MAKIKTTSDSSEEHNEQPRLKENSDSESDGDSNKSMDTSITSSNGSSKKSVLEEYNTSRKEKRATTGGCVW